ncbi:hypothetical protein [Cellulomonas sp. NPDC089187]|uniref:hypothetical protein n=1 Tax=Cellulomonas sp. NPDC089187 TaxID=3154970 RepID=UPI0034446AF5
MTTPDPQASLVAALDKLPPFGGVSFRGFEQPPNIPITSVAAALVPTTQNPLVATENGRVRAIAAFLHRTGRDLSIFSAAPTEQEVVIRPGTAWQQLLMVDVPGLTVPVLVLEELDLQNTPPGPVTWGETKADVAEMVRAVVGAGLRQPPVTLANPGKFVGPSPMQAVQPSTDG